MRRLAVVIGVGELFLAASPADAQLPPGVKTTHANGITVAYRITGTGKPLLLINGSGATLDTWDPALWTRCARAGRPIVFDPRGFGGSTDVAGSRSRSRSSPMTPLALSARCTSSARTSSDGRSAGSSRRNWRSATASACAS